MTETTRDQVFISYSRKDARWLKKLRDTLSPLLRKGALTIWDDTQIAPGQLWRNEIQQALARAKVAVLLVSPDFLASKFIVDEELPHFLQAAEKEGLTILWVPLRPGLYEESEVWPYQAAHDPKQPLSTLSPAQQETALTEIARKIKAAAGAPLRPDSTIQTEGKSPAAPLQVSPANAPENAQHLKKLIATKRRRLQELEQQAAYKGQDTPAHIRMEIDDLQQEIADLERRLSNAGQ